MGNGTGESGPAEGRSEESEGAGEPDSGREVVCPW